jgi:4-carboxymuconolactone decarboxylase
MTHDTLERVSLSKRDRSLITCAALVVTSKTQPMQFHCFRQAVENGVTENELIELITHMAYYTGRPSALAAVAKARALFGESAAEAA